MVAKCDEVPHCCDEVILKELADTGQTPPPDCEGVDCSPCKKGIIKQVADFFFPPPQEIPIIHEEPFIPEVRPEIQPEVRLPPPPPKKAPASAFDEKRKPLDPPPMHEQPITGHDKDGNPIYDTPPPMDWEQIPIISPIIDTMQGIPVNGEPPHEEQAQLDPEEIEHRKRIVADFDTQEQEKLDNKSGELTDAGWKEWDNLRATYLDVSKPRFDYWRAIAENINTHTIPPVDCEYNAWSEWSPCEGRWNDRPHKTQERHRSVKTQAKYGGTPCSESDTREEKPCPDVDCEYGAWSDWGTPALVNNPNGGEGQPEQIWAQIRTKSPLSQASGDGEVCFPPPPHNKSKKEVRPVSPVDAEWKWSDWSECGENSVSGIQFRTTILGEEAKYGGTPYEYRKEQRECEMPPEPIDCVMGEWSEWTDCMDGEQSRRRMEAVFPEHGGKPCSELRYEVRECQMPVDCEIEWLDWSPCADGIQHRNANILTKPKFGGKECDFLQETRECEMPPEPIDCVMGDWTDWTDCANGQQERTRKQTIDPQHGGVPCNEMTYESRECQMAVVAEPTPEPEPVPDETPSAGATTVMDEPEPTIVEDIVNPIVDVIIGTGEALLGWIDMGEGLEDTVTIPSQPVQVDAGTGQDSLLPVQTTPVAATVVEPEPTPAETEETPPPADDTSTGGGGAPVITTTETTEEETEVEKCEDKNRETNADGSCGASCKDGHDWDSTEADAKCVCVEGCWKRGAMIVGLLASVAGGGYYYFVKRKG